MHDCHGCQELMLEHLYELLDEAERQAFLAHLAVCLDCQSALEKARAQKSLLAAAARMPSIEMKFSPPMEEAATLVGSGATVPDAPEVVPPEANAPGSPVRAVLLPVRPRLREPVAWQPWAIAAGLLILAGGVGVPVYQTSRDYKVAERTVIDREADVADARKQVEETTEQLKKAVADRSRQLEDVRRAIKARELRLVVSGPRTVQPGAPADFKVRVVDLNNQPAQADITASVAVEGPDRRASTTLKTDKPSGLGASASRVATAPGGLTPAPGEKAASAEQKPAGSLNLGVSETANGVYRVSIPPTLPMDAGRSLDMIVAARKKGGPADKAPVTLQGKVQLTAPVYLTHLTTDKPMYQPGETVHFRSLTLDRLTLAPATESFHYAFTLTPPVGGPRTLLRGGNALVRVDAKDNPSEVLGFDGKPIKGVAAGEVVLEPEVPGGEYTLTLTEETGRFPPVQRKFLVNRYQKPRLDKKLDFNRSSYGPGDEVQASVRALRADGGPVRNCPVQVAVAIDDQLYDDAGNSTGRTFQRQTDNEGMVLVRFRLPQQIERGQASLSVQFLDAAAVETIVRPIPVVLKKLQVEFFPEGGDLVAGLRNRVYFQARTPLGKPAQVQGTLMEGETELPVHVETLHDDKEPGVNQGLGAFSFTPKTGQKYFVRIDKPAGIAERRELPTVRDSGVVLSIPGGVFEPTEPIRVRVQSSKPGRFMIGAYCRGHLLDSVQLASRGRESPEEVLLQSGGGAGGVCRVTVFEELPTGRDQRALKPVAERLVYRHPAQRVDVAISPDHRRYVPGQKVNLELLTTDEKEKLKPAILMVSVVDRSVLTLADEKTARSMPTHFLLTTEVRRAEDLEYADFLVGQHAKAPRVLDMLLGTQGWRRFAEQNPDQFRDRLRKEVERLAGDDRQRHQDEGERLLVMIGQSEPREIDLDKVKVDQIVRDFQFKAERLKEQHDEAAQALELAGSDPDYKAALVLLGKYNRILLAVRDLSVPVLTALVVALLLVALMGVRRPRRALAFGGLAALCGVLLAVVLDGPFKLPMHQPIQTERDVAMLAVPPAPERPEAFMREWLEEESVPRKEEKGETAAIAGGMGGFARGGPGGVPPPPGPPAAAKPAPTGMMAKRMSEGAGGGRGGRAAEARRALDDEKGKAVFNLEMENKTRMLRLEPMGGEDRKKQAKDLAFGFRFEREQAPLGLKKHDPQMARQFHYAEVLRKNMARDGKDKDMKPLVDIPLVVREYAHIRPTNVSPTLRSDFAETLCWHPVLVLPNGKASLSFDMCDSVTSFQVTAFAHTLDGRLGAAKKLIESRLPFTLSPKVPVEVTSTDRIDVAVGVANNTPEKRSVQLNLVTSDGLELLEGQREQRFEVAGDGRLRKLFRFRPSLTSGIAKVGVEATTAPFAADGIRETIRVVPGGFPVAGASSELLEKSATHRIKLPERWLPGTLQCQVDVYPSTLADLQKGLEGLLREPNGCFEQSSTSNYPNVLILDYLRTADKSNPELERRVRDVLNRGYQKLTSFECQDTSAKARRGYEWFGGTAPPHEALTAYGLLQFRDMNRVYEVDKDMLERTHAYLMKQRDGKGGFVRNPRAIDTFGRAPDQITNAYIVWALTESGADDLANELNALAAQAKKCDDPYFVSLVAISLTNRDRKREAAALLRTVAEAQKEDGHLDAKQTSITGSGGRDLQIETTALAVLGWLKTDALAFDKPIRNAVKWIGQQRGGYGGFGSTQSTILALKALIEHAKANKRIPEAGEVRLFIGEHQLDRLPFPAGVDKPLTLKVPDPEKNLMPGVNTLRVEITGAKNIFPHTLSWSCRTEKPESAVNCPVNLTTSLAKTELAEGETVRLKVKVKNASGANQGMTVAIVGLPAGLIVPEDLKQLKEHCRMPEGVKQPLLGAFEILGRELVLYWRDMAKDQEIGVPIDLVARVPGIYRGPASRAYLYYNADHKHWIEPLGVTIAAKP
jgi:hypothetical protein